VCWLLCSTKTLDTKTASSGWAGGLVAPRLHLQGVLVVWKHQDCIISVCWLLGSTKTASSVCAGCLVAPRLHLQGVLVVWKHQDCIFSVCWLLGSTKTASPGCAGGLVAPKLQFGTELGPETSENLHILIRLYARENFIEFCRRESCNTYSMVLLFSRVKCYRKNC